MGLLTAPTLDLSFLCVPLTDTSAYFQITLYDVNSRSRSKGAPSRVQTQSWNRASASGSSSASCISRRIIR